MAKDKKEEPQTNDDPQPQDDPVTDPVTPPEKPAETPVIDEDAIREKVKEELRTEFEQQQTERDRQLKEQVSRAFGIAEDESEDGPPAQKEDESVTDYLGRYTKWQEDDRRKKEEAQQLQQQELENTQKAQQQQSLDALRQGWQTQLTELENDGLIPKVEDPNNENDPGRKARVALFSSLNEFNKEREAANLPVTYNLYETYHRKYKGGKVAGEDAPVLGGSIKPSGGASDEVSFEDIRSSSFQDLT